MREKKGEREEKRFIRREERKWRRCYVLVREEQKRHRLVGAVRQLIFRYFS